MPLPSWATPTNVLALQKQEAEETIGRLESEVREMNRQIAEKRTEIENQKRRVAEFQRAIDTVPTYRHPGDE